MRPGLKTSKSYFHILNDPVFEAYRRTLDQQSPAVRNLHEQILDKKIRKAKRRLAGYKVSPVANLKNLQDPELVQFLENVTRDLIKEGLWKEEALEAPESSVFKLSHPKSDDLDRNLEPKRLDQIYPKNRPFKKLDFGEPQEEGLDLFGGTPQDLPQVSTPEIHNLLRRAPWNLEEATARRFVESDFFARHHEMEKLFPCAYFFSKSIFDRKLFIQIKFEAFAGTPLQKVFRKYSYYRYQKEIPLLKKLIREILRTSFLNDQQLKKSLIDLNSDMNPKEIQKELKSIWERFLNEIKGLTKKQRKALELVYAEDPRFTYTDAAKLEGISRDSFQDRVDGAVRKIKKNLPELIVSTKVKNTSTPTSSPYLYDGLYNKVEAKKISSVLYTNVLFGDQIEVPLDQFKIIPSENEFMRSIIRAWSLTKTPVPDIAFTDFYCGLFPEGHIRRLSGKAKSRF